MTTEAVAHCSTTHQRKFPSLFFCYKTQHKEFLFNSLQEPKAKRYPIVAVAKRRSAPCQRTEIPSHLPAASSATSLQLAPAPHSTHIPPNLPYTCTTWVQLFFLLAFTGLLLSHLAAPRTLDSAQCRSLNQTKLSWTELNLLNHYTCLLVASCSNTHTIPCMSQQCHPVYSAATHCNRTHRCTLQPFTTARATQTRWTPDLMTEPRADTVTHGQRS